MDAPNQRITRVKYVHEFIHLFKVHTLSWPLRSRQCIRITKYGFRILTILCLWYKLRVIDFQDQDLEQKMREFSFEILKLDKEYYEILARMYHSATEVEKIQRSVRWLIDIS